MRTIWYVFLAVGLGLIPTCALFYQSNLKATPITERQRFIIYDQEQNGKCPDSNVTQIEKSFESPLYAKTDEPYLRVAQITRRLIETNPELQPFKKWNLNVVKDPSIRAYASKAEEWRNEKKCPALPDQDPRNYFNLSNV